MLLLDINTINTKYPTQNAAKCHARQNSKLTDFSKLFFLFANFLLLIMLHAYTKYGSQYTNVLSTLYIYTHKITPSKIKLEKRH